MLEVVTPGPLLSLQDTGRPGLAHLGVPPSGACDPWALAVANVLAGAPGDAPAAELTLGGTELLVAERCAIALAGADLGAERDDGLRLVPGAVHLLAAGARIRFAGSRIGMRAYLGLAGGIVATTHLGSSSTNAATGPGAGLGRPLVAGDRLEPARRGDLAAAGRTWPSPLAPDPSSGRGPIGFVPGPDLPHLAAGTLEGFAAREWRADTASDRMGIRLDGTPLGAGHEILSHPVVPGTIQVPADGRPLILLADGPTIGGYPVLGVVPRAELPRLGQVRPGDTLGFRAQDAGAARSAWQARRRAFAAAVASVQADALWHGLADEARG